MKAVVKTKRAKGLSLVKMPDPVIGPREVLIKVNIASVCGTDVHIYDWTRWAQQRLSPLASWGMSLWVPLQRWERKCPW